MGKFKRAHEMLRHFTILILLASSLTVSSQTLRSFHKTLRIGFQYGDEAMRYEEILFTRVDNKVIGTISTPNTDKVLLSNVELNAHQIKTIDSFLYLAEKYKKKPCVENYGSSYVQYYTIINDIDTINIYRFCDWQNLTFFNIKQLVFESYLKSLEIQKTTKSAEYFIIFKGKWKESTPLDKLSLTSACDLTKIEDTSTKEYIEFISPTKLVLHRINRNLFYNYRLQFSGENTYIQLDAYKNGIEFIYGHRFLIIESGNTAMKLSRGFP